MTKRTTGLLIAGALATPMLLLATSATASADDTGLTQPELGIVRTEIIVWLEDVDDDEGDENPAPVATDITALAADHGVVVLDTLVASKDIYLVGSTDELDEKDIKKLFEKDERIRYAEPNYEGGSADGNRFHAWPAGPQGDGVGPTPVDLSEAHAHATGDGVVVAILDTGVDGDHESLKDSILPGWDFVDDDADPDDVATQLDGDDDGYVDEAWGHGTHLAGIVTQVAPDAQVLPYRVLDSDGSGRVFAVAAAMFEAVDSGADVINLSFGLDHQSRSKMLKEAMKYAKKAGVVVVAAAGNDAGNEKRYPAAHGDVISVSAIDTTTNHLAGFANHGDWVEVAAPGVAVMSTLPDGRVGTWSGSSMAAPFVAGQAALLIEYAPDENGKKVAEAIRKSSRKLEKRNDVKLKHGAVDILASLDKID